MPPSASTDPTGALRTNDEASLAGSGGAHADDQGSCEAILPVAYTPLCCKQAKSATWIRWAQISGFDCRFEVRRQPTTAPDDAFEAGHDGDDRLTLTAAARRARAGRGMRMVVANGDDQRPPDPSLLKLPSGPEPRADRPRRRPRRRRIERLCLLPSAPSLARPRHRRRHRQRPEPAATHRQEADAAHRPTAGRLGWPAPAARILADRTSVDAAAPDNVPPTFFVRDAHRCSARAE